MTRRFPVGRIRDLIHRGRTFSSPFVIRYDAKYGLHLESFAGLGDGGIRPGRVPRRRGAVTICHIDHTSPISELVREARRNWQGVPKEIKTNGVGI